jgi:hypothetical protein
MSNTQLTVHTGFIGDFTQIDVDWYDHDNVRMKDRVDILVEETDKPRTLNILINGNTVFRREGGPRGERSAEDQRAMEDAIERRLFWGEHEPVIGEIHVGPAGAASRSPEPAGWVPPDPCRE